MCCARGVGPSPSGMTSPWCTDVDVNHVKCADVIATFISGQLQLWWHVPDGGEGSSSRHNWCCEESLTRLLWLTCHNELFMYWYSCSVSGMCVCVWCYCQDHDGHQMYIGITHLGIVTFQGNKRTHQFKWYLHWLTHTWNKLMSVLEMTVVCCLKHQSVVFVESLADGTSPLQRLGSDRMVWCGNVQTVLHIFNCCPLTKLNSRLWSHL